MKGSEALTAVHGKNYEVRKSTSCVVVLIPDVDLTDQLHSLHDSMQKINDRKII